MEILAPVGNLENLRVAINHGADAIYFGASLFNARSKCQEINLNNLKECVEYAHLYNTKVYLTVNTIIKNEELDELLNMLKIAVNCKVDAFIIQDLAVYKILKDMFSNVVLHASTQMGIHNLAGAKELEELGFSRVVLSRETTLEDIQEIHKNTKLEIEYFVQGALCVAFSGNCYLSSICNNSSGNRGECLQLCRLKYSAEQNGKIIKNGYLLSTCDLCLIKNLKGLEDAGVCSLKIEGRLRRGAYVAQSIDSYKTALKDDNKISQEILKLKKVFSRGDFNYGKYLQMGKDVISPKFQNHIGVPIGKVVNVQPFKDIFKIMIESTSHKIQSGDGLKFIDGNSQQSVGVGNVQMQGQHYIIFSSTKPKIGSIVNLTLDKEEEDSMLQVERKIGIEILVKFLENETAKIYAKYESTVAFMEGEIVESAKSSPLTKENIQESFSKLKDTDFVLNNFNCEIGNVFIPKSKLNEYRRNIIEQLKNKMIYNYNIKIKEEINNNLSLNDLKNININNNNKFNYYIFNDIDQIINIKNENNIFIYAPMEFKGEEIKKELNKIDKNKIIYLNLPLIANIYDVEIIDKIIEENKDIIKGVLIHNYWGLKYKNDLSILAGYEMNITNNISYNVLSSIGANGIVKSIENNLSSNLNAGINYYGKPTLMTFAHCPVKTCSSKKCEKNCQYNSITYIMEDGKKFPIRRTRVAYCYFELIGKIRPLEKNKQFCFDMR